MTNNEERNLVVRIPKAEREKLKRKAKGEGRTVSGVVRALVAAYLYHRLDPWEYMRHSKRG